MAVKRSSAAARTADRAQPRVVYIHGIGPKPKPEVVRSMWDLALFGRELGSDSRIAYWADLLHNEYLGVEGRAMQSKGRSASQRDVIGGEQIAHELGLRGKQALQAAAFADRLLASRMDVAQGAHRTRASVGKKILPLPIQLRKPLARLFLENIVKDTAAYFFRSGMRAKIQQRLRDALPTDGKPFTLIAHSQGSIVAFEVLASLKRTQNINVETFVTIGSPLGIQEVQDFMVEQTPLVVPSCVKHWLNFADPLDVVAFDKGLANEFDPDGFVSDDVIMNTAFARGEGFDPHSAIGYLAHPSVRYAVFASTRYDTRSRFIVARDVAMSMASPERQSVLVEIVSTGKGTTSDRIAHATSIIEGIVGSENLPDARIDPLERFVSARLTSSEITRIAQRFTEINVHAIWKSSPKRKLISRSSKVIHVDAARQSYGAAGADITWAVLDTGVNSKHPHFSQHNTITEVWDCTKVGKPRLLASDTDLDGHGTHVSGIIAGASTDGSHNGMAPRAKLVVYKVLSDDGNGEDAWIIKALDHIAITNRSASELKIHGLNLSLGGAFDATVYGCGHSPVCQELRRRWREGVVICIAAGNEGQTSVRTDGGLLDLNTSMTIGDPANLDDAIVVGSVHADKPHLYGISSFSSRGPTLDGRVKPDVVAPGERISSCNTRFTARSRSSDYIEQSGTSMAAPHVSGLLAAFLSVRREFIGRPDELKALLKRTCTDIGRDVYHQGAGIPNLMKMLLDV